MSARLTLAEAARHVGCGVVYLPQHGAREDGVIVSVNDRYVMVRYGVSSVKSTRAEDLSLLSPSGDAA